MGEYGVMQQSTGQRKPVNKNFFFPNQAEEKKIIFLLYDFVFIRDFGE